MVGRKREQRQKRVRKNSLVATQLLRLARLPGAKATTSPFPAAPCFITAEPPGAAGGRRAKRRTIPMIPMIRMIRRMEFWKETSACRIGTPVQEAAGHRRPQARAGACSAPWPLVPGVHILCRY